MRSGVIGDSGVNLQQLMLGATGATNLNQLLVQSELFAAEDFSGTWYSAGSNAWTNAAGWRAVNADVGTPGQVYMDATDEYIVSPKTDSGYAYSLLDFYSFMGGLLSIETSTNGTDWVTGAAGGENVFVKLAYGGGMPSMGSPPYVQIYSAVVYDFIEPEQYGVTNSFVGRKVAVDEAQDDQNPVPLSQFRAGIITAHASNWSKYPAVADVLLNSNRLMWDTNFYTVGMSTNGGTPHLSIGWNRQPVIEVYGGYTEFVNPYITQFSRGATSTVLSVLGSSGWRPYPEYMTNLVTGTWIRMSTNEFTSTYPVLSDGKYTMTWTNLAPVAFIRTIASNETGMASGGTNMVIIRFNLQVDGKLIYDGVPTSTNGLAPYTVWCDTNDSNRLKVKMP